MVYPSEPQHSFHDWKNYSRKIPYNPVPHFKFPTESTPTSSPTTIIPEATTMEGVTKLIKDLMTPFMSTNQGSMTESNIVSSTTQNTILNVTVTDIVGLPPNPTLNISTASNNSVITDIMENVTGTSITDLMQNNSMPIDSAPNSNDTIGNNGTILTTLSEIASSTMANTASVVTNSTEKAITFITNAANNISTSTEANNHDYDHHESHYHYAMRSHHLLYVILFVIIAILILIGVILLLIYIRYRKNSFRVLQNYYEVSPMKERTPSDNGQNEQKQCPPEVYMHYHG